MKNILNFLFILFILSSCRIRTGYYHYTNQPSFLTPTPILINPYLFRPLPNYYYYPRLYTPYTNPRPRTTIILNNPTPVNPSNQSGPRGGRRR